MVNQAFLLEMKALALLRELLRDLLISFLNSCGVCSCIFKGFFQFISNTQEYYRLIYCLCEIP